MQDFRLTAEAGRGSAENLVMFISSILRLALISVLLLSFSCTAEKTGVTPGDGQLPIEERFPIDGVIDFSKLSNVQESDLSFVSIPVPDPIHFEHSTHVKWAIMNDDKNVYIAIEWTDDDHNNNYSLTSGPEDYDSIELLFDNDGDGTFESDENRFYILAAYDYAIAVDAKKSSYASDEVGNGYSFMKYTRLNSCCHLKVILLLNQ